VKNELEKLEKYFNHKELNDSWYYAVLQQSYNNLNHTTKSSQRNMIKFNVERTPLTESELVKESIKLVEPNLLPEWLTFVLYCVNNHYYLNIVKKAIYITKISDKNNTIDKISINKLDLSSFELTLCQKIINKFFITKINLFNTNYNKENNIIKIL